LKAILELFVPSHNEIGEEALDSFLERNSMYGEFIVLEIVLKITRLETTPVYQNIRPL